MRAKTDIEIGLGYLFYIPTRKRTDLIAKLLSQHFHFFAKALFGPDLKIEIHNVPLILFTSDIGFSLAGTCFSAISLKGTDRSERNLGIRGLSM